MDEIRDEMLGPNPGPGRRNSVATEFPEYGLAASGKRGRIHPMDAASVHRWFKQRLDQAGLPATIRMHELRHSAADNLWRETGNLLLAQQLLRHESVQTTQAYLHPNRDDLAAALERLDNQPVRSRHTEPT